jgi:hypothetical protein
MGETNSKNNEINDNLEIKDDLSIKRKSSILKKSKHKLISLKSSPNLLNEGAKGYLNSISNRKEQNQKKVRINIENNQYFFIDNSKKPKKTYSSTTDLNIIAKEKFLDDLLLINDDNNEENNKELNNNESNNYNEIKNEIHINNNNKLTNENNYFDDETDESNSSDLDIENENKNQFKFIYEKNYLNEINNEYININNENSLFIFNWDDTLHCNSYIIKKKNLSKEEKESLKQCEKGLKELFNITLLKGKVFLITSFDVINIETTIIKYYPSLHSKLNKVDIICIKDNIKDKYENKISCFINHLIDENNNSIKNIIFLSDCFIEDDVSNFFKKYFSNAIIKIIKFKENPNPDELNNIFNLVNAKIEEVYNDQRNLVVKIDKN